ncbi:MAG: hypothetical protein MZU91_05700 [Desulfosudis oleivorans]|nr:hypothetical protein [Desulfosudis oleivorans]
MRWRKIMTKYYPIMLDIANKRCIVIGGGNVAYRKVKSLLNFNALVRVISNDLCPELQELKAENKIEWISRNYMIGDLTDSVLVFAATDSVQTNQTIHREAQAKEDNDKYCG